MVKTKDNGQFIYPLLGSFSLLIIIFNWIYGNDQSHCYDFSSSYAINLLLKENSIREKVLKIFELFSNILSILLIIFAVLQNIATFGVGSMSVISYGFFCVLFGYVGEAYLNFLFYFPMQLVGLISGKKNRNVRKFTNFLPLIICLFLLFLFIYSLFVGMSENKGIGDIYKKNEISFFIDMITIPLGILGQVLMTFKFGEQGGIWIILNILEIIKYGGIIDADIFNLGVLVKGIVFLISSVFGAFRGGRGKNLSLEIN